MKELHNDEIWKDIAGYEGMYQVSNKGRVKSLDRIDSRGRKWKGRILKQHKDKDGYIRVGLCKDGKVKNHQVHRLVAQTFLENPNNLPQVNHINEIKTDNRVKNLEYCTSKYNNNYGNRTKNVVDTKKELGQYLRPIVQITPNGKILAKFDDVHDLSKYMDVDENVITECCINKNNDSNIYKGLRYQYADDKNIDLSPFNVNDKRWCGSVVVHKYDTGEFVDVFDSIKQAEEKLGVNHSHISAVIRGRLKQTGGYTFRKLELDIKLKSMMKEVKDNTKQTSEKIDLKNSGISEVLNNMQKESKETFKGFEINLKSLMKDVIPLKKQTVGN